MARRAPHRRCSIEARACALLCVAGAILAAAPAAALTRCEAIQRAQSWVDEQVPYSQSTLHSNACGSYRQDCSGYVSMAWALDKSYTAWSLQEVSTRLAAFDELRPGDAVNLPGSHVLLFKEWLVAGVSFLAYEQQTWGTVASVTEWQVSWAANQGYGPYRLNAIQECCRPRCDGTRVVGADCGVQQDCAAAGGRCVDDALGPRCVSPRCPASGSQRICLDAKLIGQCHDGQLTTAGSCGGDGHCSAAADAGARCVAPAAPPPPGELAPAATAPAATESSAGTAAGAPAPAPSRVVGGCSAATAHGTSSPPLALLLGALLLRRRRARN